MELFFLVARIGKWCLRSIHYRFESTAIPKPGGNLAWFDGGLSRWGIKAGESVKAVVFVHSLNSYHSFPKNWSPHRLTEISFKVVVFFPCSIKTHWGHLQRYLWAHLPIYRTANPSAWSPSDRVSKVSILLQEIGPNWRHNPKFRCK